MTGVVVLTGIALMACTYIVEPAMWIPIVAVFAVCVLGGIGTDMAVRSRSGIMQNQKDGSNPQHAGILLVNNRGQAIQVPVDTTISELVNKYGVDSIAIQEPDAPLGDDWYQAMRTSEQKAGHV